MKNRIKKIHLRHVLLFAITIGLLSGAANYSIAGGQKPVKTRKKTEQGVVVTPPNSTVPKPVFDDKPINPKNPPKQSVTPQNNNTPPRRDTLPGNAKKRNQ
ncbi:MAG: hypothetical protein L0Y76_05690 [Ignavibacteria bacterium]|nr:hypothetical protein [Ignavibacteria bacterium]